MEVKTDDEQLVDDAAFLSTEELRAKHPGYLSAMDAARRDLHLKLSGRRPPLVVPDYFEVEKGRLRIGYQGTHSDWVRYLDETE